MHSRPSAPSLKDRKLNAVLQDALKTRGKVDLETAGELIESALDGPGLSKTERQDLGTVLDKLESAMDADAASALRAVLGEPAAAPFAALESLVTTADAPRTTRALTGGGRVTALGLRLTAPQDVDGTQLLALAKAFVAKTGSALSPVQLIADDGAVSQALKLFAGSGKPGDILDGLARHVVINTDAPLPSVRRPDNQQTLPAALKELAPYAAELGYRGLRLDGERVVAKTADGDEVKLGKVDLKQGQSTDAWTREVGRLLNDHAFKVETVVPPRQILDAKADQFDTDNALLGVHLGNLAYKGEAQVKATLDAMGYDLATFSWINDDQTDTQGFVVADPDGRLVTSFRGTASFQDVVQDLKAGMRAPRWDPPADGVKVHIGFDAAIEVVWPQLTKAFAKAGGGDDGALFAGHSLGGALTQLALTRAVHEGLIDADAAQVYTVGGPRVGNEAFAKLANDAAPRTWRIVNKASGFGPDQDPVTAIPPKFLGYRHAGNVANLDDERVEVLSRGRAVAQAALESLSFSAAPAARGLLAGADDLMDHGMADLETGDEADYNRFLAQLAAQGDGDAPSAARAPAEGLALESTAALESMRRGIFGRLTGVDLHFLKGYLGRMGDELLRTLSS